MASVVTGNATPLAHWDIHSGTIAFVVNIDVLYFYGSVKSAGRSISIFNVERTLPPKDLDRTVLGSLANVICTAVTYGLYVVLTVKKENFTDALGAWPKPETCEIVPEQGYP